ncbi:hypothetical protein CsSME_00029546 [Camellia sinensis var. sinensis]
MPVDRDLVRLSSTHFFLEIENTPLPAGFHQLKFTLYDRKTDPYMHMSHFWQVMAQTERCVDVLYFPIEFRQIGPKIVREAAGIRRHSTRYMNAPPTWQSFITSVTPQFLYPNDNTIIMVL